MCTIVADRISIQWPIVLSPFPYSASSLRGYALIIHPCCLDHDHSNIWNAQLVHALTAHLGYSRRPSGPWLAFKQPFSPDYPYDLQHEQTEEPITPTRGREPEKNVEQPTAKNN